MIKATVIILIIVSTAVAVSVFSYFEKSNPVLKFSLHQDGTFYDDSLVRLLPTTGDIGSEWKELDPQKQELNGYSGFEDGIIKRFTKGNSYKSSYIDVMLYKFDTPQNAKNYYRVFVAEINKNEGFNIWNPKEMKSDNCLGVLYPGVFTDKLHLYCIKGNIVILTGKISPESDIRTTVKKITNHVLERI